MTQRNAIVLRAEGLAPALKKLGEMAGEEVDSTRLHLEIEDIKDLWGQKILSDSAYVALLLMHLRMKAISEDSTSPNDLTLDVHQFLHEYGRWEGYSPGGKGIAKILHPRHLYAIVATLEEKRIWEFASLPVQLSLEFVGG